ncbi:MAG TPA: hypothetical protein VG965_02645 [Patescibacteria group bacterium]|nr:hypothetical protein [Patescibacteria group bacterium]
MANNSLEATDGRQDPVLSTREIYSRTRDILTNYGEIAVQNIGGPMRYGEGKRAVAEVRNRPGEELIGIDSYGEPLLASEIRKVGLASRVTGENDTNIPIPVADSSQILVDFVIDPFDNSSPYSRDLDTPAWSVTSGYNHKTQAPIGGVAVDLSNRNIYRASNTGITVKNVDTGVVKDGLKKSTRTDISDPKITIASFLSEKAYSIQFLEEFKPLLEAMHDKGYLYPGGGAFIYALMAAGAVDAYVMKDEPRSEIDPGLAMLLLAGGKAYEVDPETGKKNLYKFDPELTAAPASEGGTVPFFIAVAQETIADQIIEKYMEGKARIAEQKAALALYRELNMQPGEEYHVSDYVRQMRQASLESATQG